MTTLGVLDLVPISSGSTAPQALLNSIDLALQAESLGYTRYWFAEHHLNPGVAGTSPAVLLALTAAETSTIRLGSGAVLMGPPHRAVHGRGVQPTGCAPHPGRFDLGLGRSGGKPREPAPTAGSGTAGVGQRPHIERLVGPGEVRSPAAVEIAALRGAQDAAAAAGRGIAELHRTSRRRSRADRRHLSVARRG